MDALRVCMQHCWDIPPQYGTCWPAPGSEDCAKAINGTDGKSWSLPLPPLNGKSFEARCNVNGNGQVCGLDLCCMFKCSQQAV